MAFTWKNVLMLGAVTFVFSIMAAVAYDNYKAKKLAASTAPTTGA